MRDVGLSPHLCFLGVGGGGGGRVLFWWFYFDFLRDYFFKGNIVFVLWWKFICICLTFTHSFTQFFFVLWGGVSVGRHAFYVFGHKHVAC